MEALVVPYENMGACDTHRINASVKGQNWGSTLPQITIATRRPTLAHPL